MELIGVVDAEYRGDYRLFLKFNDGLSGEVDLKEQLWGEVFEPLQDKQLFAKFSLNDWTVKWENGADLAPESLHALLQREQEAELK